ncbi:MAG TPA: YtxH domain-containing protein [Chitinophagaceae bacterium]
MNNTAKVLIAAAAGAVAGIALGLLFAPAKGEETRDTILKKGKEFADDIARQFKGAKENIKEEAFN